MLKPGSFLIVLDNEKLDQKAVSNEGFRALHVCTLAIFDELSAEISCLATHEMVLIDPLPQATRSCLGSSCSNCYFGFSRREDTIDAVLLG